MNAVGETAHVSWGLPTYIDDSEDIVITSYFRSSNTDTIDFYLDIGAMKTDNSESLSWNIESNLAVGLVATANYFQNHQYTIDSADFDVGDIIEVSWELQEASRTVNLVCVKFEYTRT
jgi:hypothetical protein